LLLLLLLVVVAVVAVVAVMVALVVCGLFARRMADWLDDLLVGPLRVGTLNGLLV
jgi:hypothetical protein